MAGDGGQLVPEVVFCGHGLLESLFAEGDLGLGGGDGFVVVASPPATAGFIEALPAAGERLFGFVSGPDQIGQLAAGLLPFFAAVWGDRGVELVDPGGRGGAGVSELVDAEGERVIGADTRCDHLGPVVVELFVESA